MFGTILGFRSGESSNLSPGDLLKVDGYSLGHSTAGQQHQSHIVCAPLPSSAALSRLVGNKMLQLNQILDPECRFQPTVNLRGNIF